ncbi:hypothetical protein PENTCL1PPCAC_8039, partial [Pristionchus entomophagus]
WVTNLLISKELGYYHILSRENFCTRIGECIQPESEYLLARFTITSRCLCDVIVGDNMVDEVAATANTLVLHTDTALANLSEVLMHRLVEQIDVALSSLLVQHRHRTTKILTRKENLLPAQSKKGEGSGRIDHSSQQHSIQCTSRACSRLQEVLTRSRHCVDPEEERIHIHLISVR